MTFSDFVTDYIGLLRVFSFNAMYEDDEQTWVHRSDLGVKVVYLYLDNPFKRISWSFKPELPQSFHPHPLTVE